MKSQLNTGDSTIGGGWNNTIQPNAYNSTIGGGEQNRIQTNAYYSTVGGGWQNTIQPDAAWSTIGGGYRNTIHSNAVSAIIPGGELNAATDFAFAAGRRAKAIHPGSFVWADSQNAEFASTTANQFAVRASGGVFLNSRLGIGLPSPAYNLDVQAAQAVARFSTTNNSNGAVLVLRNTGASPASLGAINFETSGRTPGQIGYLTNSGGQMAFHVSGVERMTLNASGLTVNGTFVSSSDRNAKEDFDSVNPARVLDKALALPLQEWTYKADPEKRRHLGPMAQDFHAAFGLGPDEKHIATVDADGVALAAIQGLNQKLEQKETEITELRQTVDELKAMIQAMNHKLNGGAQ